MQRKGAPVNRHCCYRLRVAMLFIKITSAHTHDTAIPLLGFLRTDILYLYIGQKTNMQGCSLSITIKIAKDCKKVSTNGNWIK